jgi:2-C-methyl-D-erythritol 4-phosphate cytidylyltransferase
MVVGAGPNRSEGRTGAIIVAAGRSDRMGGADKLLLPLGDRPVICHAVAAFEACELIDAIVVVAAAANRSALEGLTRGSPRLRAVVLGGVRQPRRA